MFRLDRIAVPCLLCLAALVCPAVADYGPQAGPGEGNNPAPQQNPPGVAMDVPDYIKPGYQMLYASSSSSENPDPNKQGGAGQGYTEYTVVAVLKDKVLVSVAHYLAPNGLPLDAQGNIDPGTDPRVQLSGASSIAVSKMDILGGTAQWMPVAELNKLQTQGEDFDVKPTPWPYRGQIVNAITVGIRTKDSISITTYHAQTGEKLAYRSATGPMRRNAINEMDRRHQSSDQLLGTRKLDNPLIGAAWPAWTSKVKAMSYAGTYTMAVPGVEVPPVRMSMAIQFTERGEGYILGKSTTQVQGSPPQVGPAMQGPGTMLGFWIHPNVLTQLDQGTVLENKTLRTKLTYQIQDGNLGRLGVFVLTNDAQTFYTVSAYNLQNGALTFISHHLADTQTTIQYTLDGIESE